MDLQPPDRGVVAGEEAIANVGLVADALSRARARQRVVHEVERAPILVRQAPEWRLVGRERGRGKGDDAKERSACRDGSYGVVLLPPR
jgi:hypothetical protein